MNWKQAKLGQLYEIAFHDKGCDPRHKLAANEEIRRRKAAKRANIKYVDKGRNYG
jgi:hypothetical protein